MKYILVIFICLITLAANAQDKHKSIPKDSTAWEKSNNILKYLNATESNIDEQIQALNKRKWMIEGQKEILKYLADSILIKIEIDTSRRR